MKHVKVSFDYAEDGTLNVETVCENSDDFALMFKAMLRIQTEVKRLLKANKDCPFNPATILQASQAEKDNPNDVS